MTIAFTARRMSPPTAYTHEAITDLWWRNVSTGETGVSTKAVLVDFIDNKDGTAVVDGYGTPVVTVHPAGRPAYLQSKANGVANDNLLSLPVR